MVYTNTYTYHVLHINSSYHAKYGMMVSVPLDTKHHS